MGHEITLFFNGFAVLRMFLSDSASPFGFPSISHYFIAVSTKEITESMLDSVLRNASMMYKTMMIITLSDAWGEPGSIFDLFLESFHGRNQTMKLLNQLVAVTLDQKTYARCLDCILIVFNLKPKVKISLVKHLL
ncbi:hypothetical protein Lalb_Chr15g0080821 [Lupinus albus]|uniref:Uncharacterized protein n=1 Tax=Lupinus albus TaxID=3870 RepID=A0A6A4PDG0_LUPAL|nr:hypothetical protein Lalb_Chr15g0080821 [Lupinus albus]